MSVLALEDETCLYGHVLLTYKSKASAEQRLFINKYFPCEHGEER